VSSSIFLELMVFSVFFILKKIDVNAKFRTFYRVVHFTKRCSSNNTSASSRNTKFETFSQFAKMFEAQNIIFLHQLCNWCVTGAMFMSPVTVLTFY